MELGSQRFIPQGVSILKPLPPFTKLTCNIYSETATPPLTHGFNIVKGDRGFQLPSIIFAVFVILKFHLQFKFYPPSKT